MNTKCILFSRNSICEGCLSVDRKLTPSNAEETNFFKCILDNLDTVNCPPLFCWECSAVIRNSLKFKRKAERAHKLLVHSVLDGSCLPTLSHLSKSKLDATVYSVNAEDNLFGSNSHGNIKIKEYKYEDSIRDNDVDENQKCGELLMSVKTEEQCTDYLDDEVCFADDFGEVNDRVEEIKTFHQHNSSSASMEYCRATRRKRKKIQEDFKESDDEPLEYIKEKKAKQIQEEIKVKKKNKKGIKKMDTDQNASIDRGPRTKREKPSGVVFNSRVERRFQKLNIANGQLEMVVRSWEEVEVERQKALTSDSFTRHEFKCYDCVVGFNHKLKLESHMKKHDSSSGTAVCSVCRIVCRDSHSLTAHRRRHRVRWRCCLCGEAWSNAAIAADHCARVHLAPQPTHTCSLCGHTEPTLGKIRKHMKSHSERQKCELCGKTFRDGTSLRTHLFVHKGEKEYECPKCGKRFLFKKAMEVHLITHDASAQIYCHQCDMNFKNRMSYYQHMKYNLKHIDPAKLKYACHLCDKKFVKAVRLEEHNLAVHLKVTPIKCTTTPDCNFACSSRAVLRTHIRMVHRDQRSRRNHVCDTCGKAYTTKKCLEGHIRSHTGERPYQCTLCPANFGYQAALYNHNKLVHLKSKANRARVTQPAACPVPPTTSHVTAIQDVATFTWPHLNVPEDKKNILLQ